MFILKNKIINKVFHKHGQYESDKKESQLKTKENKNCNGNNLNLKEEYEKAMLNEKSLREENRRLLGENQRLKNLNDFVNFQEFLAYSYVSPIINTPFSASDKRVFAFMDHLSKYLIKNISKLDEKPLVSIILPTDYGESTVKNAVNSVLSQSYENWELIVIVDGSDDNTLNLLNSFSNSKIKILTHESNEGISCILNTGLKEANGKYIMYLDDANQWDSRYVETMIGAFIELPDADAIYSGQLLYKDFNSSPYAIRFGSFNKPLLHNRNYIDMGCFCHKRYIFDEIGGFDENLIHLIDWDYILRISNQFKLYSVPVLLSKYCGSSSLNSFSDDSFDYYETASEILEKNSIPTKEHNGLSKKVSIIIPSYESLIQLKNCVESILSFNLNEMLDIIIVDNNSNIEVREYIKKLESQGVKYILNDVNYGFSYGVNQGIDISDEDSDILILNNDAILTKGVIEHLQEGAYSYPDCGLIVPHELVSEGNHHMNYNVPYADTKFKCDVTPSKEHHNIINMPVFHDGGLLELEFAPFFCTYIKRGVYDQTLGLDPELGRHYRSDRIFSDFIRHILKMKIYQEPNAYVFHEHQVATKLLSRNKEEYDMMFKKNQWPPDLAKKLGYKKALWD